MGKHLISAAYVREYLFDTIDDYNWYISNNRFECKVISYRPNGDGSILAVIYQQYNNSKLYTPEGGK